MVEAAAGDGLRPIPPLYFHALLPRPVSHRSAGALKSYLTPASDPETPVSAETVSHLQRAKLVSTVAVSVSASLVAGAAATARSLATALSSAVLSTDFGKRMSQNGQTETGQAVKHVAASGLVAFGETVACAVCVLRVL